MFHNLLAVLAHSPAYMSSRSIASRLTVRSLDKARDTETSHRIPYRSHTRTSQVRAARLSSPEDWHSIASSYSRRHRRRVLDKLLPSSGFTQR